MRINDGEREARTKAEASPPAAPSLTISSKYLQPTHQSHPTPPPHEHSRVNNRDRQQDPRSAPQRADQIRRDTQQPNHRSSKDGRRRNDPLELPVHASIPVPIGRGEDHALLLELLGDVSGARAGDFDPGFGEEGAGGEHKDDIEGGVDRIEDDGGEGTGRGHVVAEARAGGELGRVLEGLRKAVSGEGREGEKRRTSQTPRRRMKKFSGKRLKSIWLTTKTFEVRALSSMMGICGAGISFAPAEQRRKNARSTCRRA